MAGLALGLSASMGLFFLSDDVGELVASRSQGPEVTQIESAPPPAVESPKAKFDFYQLLPEMEVAVEEAEITAVAPVAKSTEPAAPLDGRYVIQVASFRQLADADGVKASLALIGLEGEIQTVLINGETWHRVRLGPYTELAGLNDARSRLYDNNFEAQVY